MESLAFDDEFMMLARVDRRRRECVRYRERGREEFDVLADQRDAEDVPCLQ